MTGANYSTLGVCHEEIAKKNASSWVREKGIVIDFLRRGRGRSGRARGDERGFHRDSEDASLA